MAYKLIESELEKILISAIASAFSGTSASTLPVVGHLQTVADGKTRSFPTSAVCVNVSPRFNESLGSRDTRFHTEIIIAVGTESDPTGSIRLAAETEVTKLLQSWNDSVDLAASALSVPDAFAANGFLFTEGGLRLFDIATSTGQTNIACVIIGCLLSQSSATTTTTQG